MENAKRELPEIPEYVTYCASPYEAARGAHALLILNEAPEFRRLRFSRLRQLMQIPLIVDGRNLLEPDEVRKAGFEYISVGRGTRVSNGWESDVHESAELMHERLDWACTERERSARSVKRAPLRH